jgi:type I restriction enzyme, S subunit
MNEKKELPEGWKWEKLGEICKTTSGGTPNRKENKYYDGNIPWVKSGELDKGIILDTEEKITDLAIKNSSAKIFPKGTLLIALYGATIGKLAFLGINAATNQAICGIYENEDIYSKYLFNYLTLKKQDLVNQGIGGAQPNISQTILKNLEIPVPSIKIQIKIVSKIEELLSELEKAIESLKLAKQQLKSYRQSVLKWAFEGKLTNEFSESDELPKSWNKISLKDLCDKVESVKRNRVNLTDEIIYLDIGGIDNIKNKILEFKRYKWIDAPSRAQQIVFQGDTLFSTVRTYMKNIALVDNKMFDGEIASSGFCIIRGKQNILDPKYIFYYSTSEMFLKPLNKLQTGSSYPAVRDSDVFSQLIPICSINEQKKIAGIIETRFSMTEKIEEGLVNSLNQSDSLKKSILKKAFEGKLF